MTTALLHILHAAIVVVGAAVVLFLVRPAPDRRRVAALRRAAADGTLVAAARERAVEQLEVAARRQARSGTPRARPALWIASMLTLLAAVVHAAVGPEHFREALRFGLFFVALSVDQLVLAAVLLRRPSVRVAWFAIVVNAGTVALWIVTRTVGLPFGLSEVESVGVLDVVSTVAEIVAAGAAAYWLAVRVRPALFGRVDRSVPVVPGSASTAR